MKKYLVIGAVVLLLILIPMGLWWFSEGKVVARRSEQLMAMLSIEAGTNTMLRHAKVLGMKGMLAPTVEISSPSIEPANGEFRCDELESAYSWICRNAVESSFIVSEFQSVTIDGDHAEVIAIVDGFMQLPKYQPVDGQSEVTLHWNKQDGNWRLKKMIWTSY
jgi:hypothetical protein